MIRIVLTILCGWAAWALWGMLVPASVSGSLAAFLTPRVLAAGALAFAAWVKLEKS